MWNIFCYGIVLVVNMVLLYEDDTEIKRYIVIYYEHCLRLNCNFVSFLFSELNVIPNLYDDGLS